jgi:hypothetical protein
MREGERRRAWTKKRESAALPHQPPSESCGGERPYALLVQFRRLAVTVLSSNIRDVLSLATTPLLLMQVQP